MKVNTEEIDTLTNMNAVARIMQPAITAKVRSMFDSLNCMIAINIHLI